MSTEEKVDVSKLRTDVSQEIDNDAHGKIARICRTVLASRPDELLWLRLLCCAMIHLSQNRAVLQFIETYAAKPNIYDALLFYKIYALYLLKDNESAKEALDKTASKTHSADTEHEQLAIQYLKFQIFYRLALYDEALQHLNQMKGDDGHHLNDIAVNKIATYIAMNKAGQAVDEYYSSKSAANTSLRSNCDFVFNLGTALILNGQIEDAKSFLVSSLTNCEKALREIHEYEDAEIAAEIGNLQLLIAYCHHEQGDEDEAARVYQQLTEKQQMNGIYHKLILQNNSLAINLPNEVFEAHDDKKEQTKETGKKSSKKKESKSSKSKSKSKNKQKEHEKKETKTKRKKKKKASELDAHSFLYKTLLNAKNEENFSRIGVDQRHGISELIKAYHNKCIIHLKHNDEAQFKSVLARIRARDPLSEIPLFLRVSHYFNQGRYQQCKDVLSHHLSTNGNASQQSKLMYVQSLILLNKYRAAITQIRLLSDEVRFAPKMIRVLLALAKRAQSSELVVEHSAQQVSAAITQIRLLSDEVRFAPKMIRVLLALAKRAQSSELVVEVMKEIIEYLQKTGKDDKLLIAMQIKLCRLLIAKRKANEAKSVAQSLYDSNRSNATYQAMLLLTAVATKDMGLAEKISSEIELDLKYDAYAVDDLAADIPNVYGAEDQAMRKQQEEEDEEEEAVFSFEISAEMELRRKREAARRKREKNAVKLRKKYKEHPELYKEAVDWESKKERKGRGQKTDKTDSKKKQKSQAKKGGKSASPQKKKGKSGGFRGAQGGSGQSEKYQVFEVGDPKNKKSNTAKTVIPDHIKKRKK
eukprot:CAMPEP_0197072836 /NCGR_PEP_ID=MMETSP1384-20130603/210298_1 /TAXON_ID=29189 /ORGANISM="Ammonia sp." /LENGTH=811 /DNA_ID=CAMNT_0042511657 /DNA_START=9 /DNA_END=2445 /DNA_ORIENTATION=+